MSTIYPTTDPAVNTSEELTAFNYSSTNIPAPMENSTEYYLNVNESSIYIFLGGVMVGFVICISILLCFYCCRKCLIHKESSNSGRYTSNSHKDGNIASASSVKVDHIADMKTINFKVDHIADESMPFTMNINNIISSDSNIKYSIVNTGLIEVELKSSAAETPMSINTALPAVDSLTAIAGEQLKIEMISVFSEPSPTPSTNAPLSTLHLIALPSDTCSKDTPHTVVATDDMGQMLNVIQEKNVVGEINIEDVKIENEEVNYSFLSSIETIADYENTNNIESTAEHYDDNNEDNEDNSYDYDV